MTMKLISSVFTSEQIEITVVVQNRATKGQGADPDTGLITKYISRVGNESLIFAPSVAIQVRSRISRDLDAYVPLSLFYRLTGNLSSVYSALSDKQMYRTEGAALYVDKKRALEFARKLPLFRNTLTMIPEVYVDRSNTYSKGIILLVDMRPLGVLHHQEALGLIEQLDHLDITTYSLLAGIVDEMERTNSRLDGIYEMLQKIHKQLERGSVSSKAEPIKVPDPVSELPWVGTTEWRPMS